MARITVSTTPALSAALRNNQRTNTVRALQARLKKAGTNITPLMADATGDLANYFTVSLEGTEKELAAFMKILRRYAGVISVYIKPPARPA